MDNHYYAVIMAGGGGTRLWPLSRQSTPKQMLRLAGNRTLFEIAVARLEGVFPPDRVMVVTIADQAEKLRALYPEIPQDNFLIEPMPRGTASVVGLATAALLARDPQAIMAVLTADHFIQNEPMFRLILKAAHDVALDNYLVTLGIIPTYPATGYGYIQRGQLLGEYQDFPVYRVLHFKEKPGEEAAQAMLDSRDHDWNSGMFIWKAERILEEFACQMPELAEKIKEIGAAWNTSHRQATIEEIWPKIRAETIDYGIMEHARQVAVIPADGLGWNDIGSWDSLFDVIDGDQHGNIVVDANHIAIDTHDTLVFDRGSKRLIVTIGISDLIVVDTGDTLLICDKNQTQQVRQAVTQLKKENRIEYL